MASVVPGRLRVRAEGRQDPDHAPAHRREGLCIEDLVVALLGSLTLVSCRD
jgi:hypothetical protein